MAEKKGKGEREGWEPEEINGPTHARVLRDYSGEDVATELF